MLGITKKAPQKKQNALLEGTLDTNQAAQYIGVSAWLLRQYDKRGVLKPRFRHGRNRRYLQDDLDAWIQATRQEQTDTQT